MEDNKVFIDFETESDVDLKEVGTYAYAMHKSTRILTTCFSYRDKLRSGRNIIKLLRNYKVKDMVFVAHNAQFDRLIWNNAGVRDFGLQPLDVNNWRCTMARCHQLSIPASLAKACDYLRVAIPKDDAGGKAMLRISKGKSDSIEDWLAMEEYVKIDVQALCALHRKVGLLPEEEQRVWELDQKINDLGVCFDADLARACIKQVDAEKRMLTSMFSVLSDVSSPMSRIKYKKWLWDQGAKVENTAKDTLLPLLNKDDINDVVKEVIRLGVLIAKASTAKYKTMVNWGSATGRIHGVHQYHAATTGRWGGRGVQLQNLPRGIGRPEAQANIIKSLKEENTGVVDLFGGIMTLASESIRGGLVAGEGKEFIVLDFSQIEARVLAWCANDDKTLEIFRSGRDVYKDSASSIYRIPYEDITEAQRFVGKVATLALGYQGWVGAFSQMAKTYGLDVTEGQAADIAGAWRNGHPEIVEMWRELDRGVFRSVSRRSHDKISNFCYVQSKSGNTAITLPSGRQLAYLNTSISTNDKGRAAVHFDGYYKPGRWGTCSTYGGKLTENVVQAISADLLRYALINIDKAGYDIAFHVHDEIIVEANEGTVSVQEISDIMNTVPSWATGLPIECEGFKAKRYRK